MYYIDAMESEIALFDFPGLSPATESTSGGIGDKLAKILKFIAKKIKDFIKRVIAIIKMIFGNRGMNSALDVKNAAIKDINMRIKTFLPNKDVTDLTKVKGLSSYTGGESGPYISDVQADNIRQSVEQSLDIVIKEYTNDLKIFKSDLSEVYRVISTAAKDIEKISQGTRKAVENNDTKSVLFNYRVTMTNIQDASEKSDKIKNDILSTIDTSKKNMASQIRSLVDAKTKGIPQEVENITKSIIDRYAINIKIALRSGDSQLNSEMKNIESLANELEKLADLYESTANILRDAYDELSVDCRNAFRDGSKITLEFSKTLHMMTSAIKTSTDGNVFTS